MTNSKPYRKAPIFCMLLTLLLSLCIPVMPSNAEDKVVASSIHIDDTLETGVTIQHPKIEISYYDYENNFIEKESGTYNLAVKGCLDPYSGSPYITYTVTALNVTIDNLSISLKGKKNEPELKRTLMEITIQKPPSKTKYTEGERFDKAGMVVMACYLENSWRNITNYTIRPEGPLKKGTDKITISFTEKGVTKTATQGISVKAKQSENITISANAAAGGSISDAGNSLVKRGNSKTYNITPDNGYRINYVEVDGTIVGAVSSYTFDDVQDNHSITAYFLSGSTPYQNTAARKTLTIVGSFAPESGAGSYVPGTKIPVNAGMVPGFTFTGWLASDGTVYPSPVMSYVMPGYDVLLYANWTQAGAPNAVSPVTTTNLKGQQLTNWTDITNKLATFSAADTSQPGESVLRTTLSGTSCLVDAAAVAMLNTRQGIALDVSYGPDASFTFYSDVDNSQFAGTDLTYSCNTATTLFFREKSIVFAQPGMINTGICLNLLLPEAQQGQTAYVYLVNENGAEIMYLPTVVDADKKITIPLSTKITLKVKY